MSKPTREVFRAASQIVMGRVPIRLELKEIDDKFIKRWNDSEETDFGIYSDPEYVKTLLYCWSCTSGPHIRMCLDQGLIRDGSTILDFHGGIGMSAALLAMHNPNSLVINHSIVKEHNEIAKKLFEKLNLTNVMITNELMAADLFIAQETFEHIKDPFNELRQILDEKVMPSQYLDGTSFTIPGPGHFNKTGYMDGDIKVGHKQAKKRLNKVLMERGFMHYSEVRGIKKGYNGHPWMWERKKESARELHDRLGFTPLTEEQELANLDENINNLMEE